MVIVPEHAPVAVRIAATERRITACRSSAKVLSQCSSQVLALSDLEREIARLEAELAVLKAPAGRDTRSRVR